MDNYIVSARKYRPSSFDLVVGQDALTHTLKTSIKSGRLAHAYLFCGSRGVGKTTCARIFAKTINCTNLRPDGEACNECESCRSFNEGRSLNVIEMDAASNNSVDEMRSLVEKVRIPPQLGKYKVYIIDEVHMLSSQAFNAFLKTLEEPPEHAIFILATTEKQKIIPTILSRCQIYDFSRITIDDISRQLQMIANREGLTVEPSALNVIAQKADGAMRDALSIFDQVAASTSGNITYAATIENLNILDYEYYFRLVDAFMQGDAVQSLLIYKDVRDHSFDSLYFIDGLASHFRNLFVAKNPATLPLLDVTTETAEKYKQQAAAAPVNFLFQAMQLCGDCINAYKESSNKQFLVELTLIKLCHLLNPLPPAGNDPLGVKNMKATIPNASTATSQQPKAQATQSPVASVQPNIAEAEPAAQQQYSPQLQHVELKPQRTTSHASNPRKQERISIRDIDRDESEASASKDESQDTPMIPQRNSPFTETMLQEAWNSYIDTNPTEVVLVNTMMTSFPKQDAENPNKYHLVVDNNGQAQIVKSHLAKLVDFMRDKLDNDMFMLTLRVEAKVVKEKYFTPTELLGKMMSESEAVKNMIKKLSLSLD